MWCWRTIETWLHWVRLTQSLDLFYWVWAWISWVIKTCDTDIGFLKINSFMYLWLCWVFAVHGLFSSWGPGAGPVLLTLLFPPLLPSSYCVLRGSIYSLPVVRYSCLLSAGVLQDLLCLKVYSWWIRGERCTPRLPTPLPSCYPQKYF